MPSHSTQREAPTTACGRHPAGGDPVDDDPATEVLSWQGRYLYFHPEEIEPAGGPGAVP